MTNIRDVLKVVTLRNDDRMLSFLPPFHSFGLVVNMLAPLTCGFRAVFHANPTEPWVLAKLVEAYRATLLVGTPTFLGGIIRAAKPGQLKTLRLAVTGAEACPERTFNALKAACPSVTILEGYGITECSPIVSANRESEARLGSIGRMLPSVEHAIVNPETFEPVSVGQPGLMLVRGPSVFGGYLGGASASPFVEYDGKQWYRTGDLVSQDAEGILTFRGRLKRFVKLGGEMISLPAIETALSAGQTAEPDAPVIAVDAVGNEEHPELILFTTLDLDRTAANLRIREAGLSALHNVARVVRVAEIPLLGTGKTNYRALREIAAGGPRVS